MWFTLRYLYLATVVLCAEQPRVENVEEVKQSFHFRRAVDGSRGRNYFNHDEDGSYDSYHSESGYYDSGQVKSGFSDIRSNVPGEPGVDYPAYESVPKTRFSCEGRAQGYYADEDAGCQAFHVCHDVVLSSFICPVGSIFSQELLTCDWWNKVDCTMTDAYHSSRQGIGMNDNEMVQKAYTMTQLSEPNSMKNEPQIGAGRLNTGSIAFNEKSAADISGRESQYHSNYPTKQIGGFENFEFGRTKAIVNDNTQPKPNFVTFNLRPNNFQRNNQGQNSRVDNRAKDSSIFYVQKNDNYNAQDNYSTLRPFTVANNFQHFYQQDKKVVKNEYQPSYAPTVPTTRKLYSPTIPTTSESSTTSYNTHDQYFGGSDHFYSHGKNYLTTRSTVDYDEETAANNGQNGYNFGDTVQPEGSIGLARTFGEKLNKGENDGVKKAGSQTGANVQSGESKKQDNHLLSTESNLANTGAQSRTNPTNFDSNISRDQQNYQHFYYNQLALGKKQDEQATGKVNTALVENDTQAHGTNNIRNEKNLNSINSPIGIQPLIVQIPRPSGPSGRPVIDIADQLFTIASFETMSTSTPRTTPPVVSRNIYSTDEGIQDLDSSTRIPPLIPQFLRPTSWSRPESPSFIPPLISQIPQSNGSLEQVSTNVHDPTQNSVSSSGIPPLIPEFLLPTGSSGLEFPSVLDDNKTSDSPSRSDGSLGLDSSDVDDRTQTSVPPAGIPPLISQIPQSEGSLEQVSTNVHDQTQNSVTSNGIPPLIPEFLLPTGSSGLEFPSVLDDHKTFDSPSKSDGSLGLDSSDVDDRTQNSVTSNGIPPLIPEFLLPTGSSGPEFPNVLDDNKTSDSPSRSDGSSGLDSSDVDDRTQTSVPPARIPPLISQIPQSDGSSGQASTNVQDQTQNSVTSNGIPPLIPEFLLPTGSLGPEFPSVLDDNKTSDSPSRSDGSLGLDSSDVDDRTQTSVPPARIPPLISQIPQSDGSSGQVSTNVQDQTQDSVLCDIKPQLIPEFLLPTGSSGPELPSVPDDNKTSNSPSRSGGSLGLDSSDVDDRTPTTALPTSIPPLISQSLQTTTSSGPESSSVLDDDNFDSLPLIPPLIPQIPQSDGSLGLDSSDVDDRTQTSVSPTSIPPLISQASQPTASPEAESPIVIDDNKTYDSLFKVPPLIPQISQSDGSLGLDSSDVDDRTQTSVSPTRIPPLISQASQPTASPEAESLIVIDDNKTYDSSFKVPPLIPQIPQSDGSSGQVSTDVDVQTEVSVSSTRIPPLIPQFSQPTGLSETESSGVLDDDNFDFVPLIPPLIPQIPQSDGSLGLDSSDVDDRAQTTALPTRIPPSISQFVQSTTSSGPESPSLIDDNSSFDSPSRIPPLISQIPQSDGSSGQDSTDVDDRIQTTALPTRIPPLILQFPRPTASSEPESPSLNEDNKIFNSPSKIPPLISQLSQFDGTSEVNPMDVDDRTQTSVPPTRIRPLISQASQPTASPEAESPIVIDDNKTYDSSFKIPSLISQIPQFDGSSGVDSTDVRTQSSESAATIPSLDPQSVPTSGPQSPIVIDDDKSFHLPPLTLLPPLISEIPHSLGSSGVDSKGVEQTPTFETSTKNPSIPSSSQSAVSSGVQSQEAIEDKYTIKEPPKVPLISQISRPVELPGIHSTNNFDQKQIWYHFGLIPSSLAGPWQPTDSSSTYSHNVFNSFNSWPRTTPAPHFTFGGQYQRPLPFNHLQIPSRQPVRQFVTIPTTDISDDYDYSKEYGSKLRTETTTTGPSKDSANSAAKEFIINVPDFASTEETYSTQSTILSTPSNPHFSGVSAPQDSVDQSYGVGSISETSSTSSSYVKQTPDQTSEVVSHLPTSDNQQSSVTDLPNVASSLLPPINHGGILISTEDPATGYNRTEVKAPLLTVPIPNVDRSNYNLYKQASAAISSASDTRKPISQNLGTSNSAEYNNQFTIRGALKYPTVTPSPPLRTVSLAYIPQSPVSPPSTEGKKVFDLEKPSVADGSAHLPHPENLHHNTYQETTTPNPFNRVTFVESSSIPTSSQSPLDNSGHSKEQFEFSTPKNVLDTVSIKSLKSFNASRNVLPPRLPQPIGTSSPLPELPFGFTHVEPSVNNNDSPYEISFTVNGDEEFNPSGDFINKLLAQHESNLSLGLDGFEGFEIVKSDNPFDPGDDDDKNTKSTIVPTIKPSAAPDKPRIFDPRSGFDDQPSENKNTFFNQNPEPGPSILKTSDPQPTRINLLKSDNLPRPFFFGNDQDAVLQTKPNSKSNDFSTFNPPLFDTNFRPDEFQNNEYLSKLRIEAQDINRSLESLLEFQPPTFESPPLKKEQILEELTKHFGQPLYGGNPQRNFGPPEAPQNVNYNAAQQFANLQLYRAGKNAVSNQETALTSPAPPKPSTTTTPQPVKTFVETEFIPSLSFSFDSDDGRQEYVEAVLKGLLTDRQPADPWTDAVNFFRESREDSKSKNATTEVMDVAKTGQEPAT